MDYELLELKSFLDEEGHLTAMPAKHKKKLAALWYLAEKIEAGRKLTSFWINGRYFVIMQHCVENCIISIC